MSIPALPGAEAEPVCEVRRDSPKGPMADDAYCTIIAAQPKRRDETPKKSAAQGEAFSVRACQSASKAVQIASA